MLHHNQRARRFVGTRYLVTADAFFERLRWLCRAGGSIVAALNILEDERAWSLSMAGVAPIFTADTVINEAAAILAIARHSTREER